MLDQLTARLRRFLGKAREGHYVHAPFCNQLRIEAIVLGENAAGTGELTKFARIDASDGQANCEQTSIGRGGCGLPVETGAMA